MYIKKVLTKLWQLLEKRQNSRKEDGISELRTEHYWGKSQGYNIILLLLCMPKWCNLAIKEKKKKTYLLKIPAQQLSFSLHRWGWKVVIQNVSQEVIF